ncbi:hypothetical protein KSP40_PGU002124 [Platanthera guangdongensis]|uniref:Uncharacterized protein n=1 Tax=Platanthera guangdongensis TaxID=2320717 RepID=A0ABR2LET2_9ASPA
MAHREGEGKGPNRREEQMVSSALLSCPHLPSYSGQPQSLYWRRTLRRSFGGATSWTSIAYRVSRKKPPFRCALEDDSRKEQKQPPISSTGAALQENPRSASHDSLPGRGYTSAHGLLLVVERCKRYFALIERKAAADQEGKPTRMNNYLLAEWMNQIFFSGNNYLAELEELQLSSFAFQAISAGLELSSLMEKKMSNRL